MVRRKYLNDIVEQDHRFIKRRTGSMLGFKSFALGAATGAGTDVVHMIRRRQCIQGLCPIQQFKELVA
jgi:putative transposase